MGVGVGDGGGDGDGAAASCARAWARRWREACATIGCMKGMVAPRRVQRPCSMSIVLKKKMTTPGSASSGGFLPCFTCCLASSM